MTAILPDAAAGLHLPGTARPPRPLLLHSPAWTPPAPLAEALESRRIASLADIAAPDAPAVLVLDRTLAEGAEDLEAALRALPDAAIIVAADGETDALARGSERVLLALPAEEAGATRALRGALRLSAARLAQARLERELAGARAELRELAGVGMALMTERDPDRLLRTILSKARQLTASDAGSLYLVEEDENGERRLCFALAQNDSIDAPFQAFTLPLDTTSMAGYAAITGETLRVSDAYDLPADAPYRLNRSFDERFGYRTCSVLVVPMVDHPGNVVGVLQLINHKRDPAARIDGPEAAERWVVPYRPRELELVQALAGQAAVSIENSRLYRQVENLFESFVKAAVVAVDQRDPATSGHSVRVATLTCDLAAALERGGRGRYAGVRFSREQMRELRYASLLHDFGKVGVREEVLVKPKKLPPLLMERVQARFAFVRRTLEMEHYRARAEAAERGEALAGIARRDAEARLAELERVRALVMAANEPTILPERAAAELDELARLTFAGPDGTPLPYLTEEELAYLHIPKGSLTDEERREIESHVEQTYRFLVQIPWTGDLRNVAAIAYGHHEKLNGGGYPRGVTEAEIPPQTRMMTVADIFDALTASDRPYKRAVSPDRAIDILHMEAREGLLDADLVETMVESGVYRRILDVDWRAL
ncbi:MAG TPA: HD domain-containing phosphohydrolase [Longimicrobium sp.]|nr:HD domain-containing phosphohydrolase [Longimicrobium sp.]